MSPLALALLLAVPSPAGAGAPTLWPGYADDAFVRGLRPPPEVTHALAAALPSLSVCATPTSAPGMLTADIEILAAGYVDRVTVLSNSLDDASLACVQSAARALALRDRGTEAPSHAVVRFAISDGAAPPARTSPKAIAAALEVKRDDIVNCVERARKQTASTVDLAGTVVARFTVAADGNVRDIDVRAGTLDSAFARACIAGALAAIKLDVGAADTALVWPLAFDKPFSRQERRRPTTQWEQPTLFEFLGCASAFSP